MHKEFSPTFCAIHYIADTKIHVSELIVELIVLLHNLRPSRWSWESPRACLSTTPPNKPDNKIQESIAEIQDIQNKTWVNLSFVVEYRITDENVVRIEFVIQRGPIVHILGLHAGCLEGT